MGPKHTSEVMELTKKSSSPDSPAPSEDSGVDESTKKAKREFWAELIDFIVSIVRGLV